MGLQQSAQKLGVQVSPFGVIPKKGKPNKWIDLSSPAEHSLNDGISKEDCSLQHISVSKVELQQIFDLFGYSLEFWYSDSIRLHLVFIYMEFMRFMVKLPTMILINVMIHVYYS